jgi:hypothetical protein
MAELYGHLSQPVFAKVWQQVAKELNDYIFMQIISRSVRGHHLSIHLSIVCGAHTLTHSHMTRHARAGDTISTAWARCSSSTT